jgi:hypothetical protein
MDNRKSRQVLFNENAVGLESIDDYIELAREIDEVDNRKNINRVTESYNMHKRTISLPNRCNINSLFNQETSLIFKN